MVATCLSLQKGDPDRNSYDNAIQGNLPAKIKSRKYHILLYRRFQEFNRCIRRARRGTTSLRLSQAYTSGKGRGWRDACRKYMGTRRKTRQRLKIIGCYYVSIQRIAAVHQEHNNFWIPVSRKFGRHLDPRSFENFYAGKFSPAVGWC